MNANIIVLGSLNIDLVIRGRRLPRPGETVIDGDFYEAFGGKGANQAVAAARVASSTGAVGLVGALGNDRFGHEYLSYLEGEGVVTRYVRKKDYPTGVAMILVDDQGENLISVASGANRELSVADVDAIDQQWIQGAQVWLTNLESPLDAVQRGLQRARENGLYTILNPAPIPADAQGVVDRLLPLADLIIPNEVETEMLIGEFSAPDDAAEKLSSHGSVASVITLGKRGCFVAAAGTHVQIPAHRVDAVDATAAGDAFCGALAGRIAAGDELLAAAHYATAAAALAVMQLGAQPSLPTHDRIMELLQSR